MTEYVTPNIHTVLKKYQTSAPKSLQGPGHALTTASCPTGTNCPLDASLPGVSGSGNTGNNNTDINIANIRNLCSGHLSAGILAPNGLSSVNNKLSLHCSRLASSSSPACSNSPSSSSGLPPAVTLIKKEVLSSPEPHELSETLPLALPLSMSSQTTQSQLQTNPSQPPNLTTIKIIPPPPPELSQPILTAPDSGSGILYETRLEGKTIGCFSLGGEMRLCLPQFLNNVLADFTLDQINRIFDELGIYCSQCTPDQLLEFKTAKILPSDVKASGLITRTDAERLCAALLHRVDRNNYINDDDIPKGAISFKVYHRCFGKCDGICTPDLYSYNKPTCIMCLECKGWFSPQKFVGHVHRGVENRTCHWGFDSRNWHDYLHVALDVENREKYQKILDELKEVEIKEALKAQNELFYMKRKAALHMDEDMMVSQLGHPLTGIAPTGHLQAYHGVNDKQRAEMMLDIPTKKAKSLDEASAYQLEYQRYQSLMYAHCAQQQQRVGSMSAFRPWAPKSFLHPAATYNAVAAFSTIPYLSQEPPVLQNPERVVRSTDRERFERTYQPNVALVPRKCVLAKEREKEHREYREREREREHERVKREREVERMREREQELSREREQTREREERELERERRERQIQHQQHRQQHLLHQQKALQEQLALTNMCDTQVQIKQERANTPNEMPQSPPFTNNSEGGGGDRDGIGDDPTDRHSSEPMDEDTTLPMITPNPMSLTMCQLQPQQQKQQQQRKLSSNNQINSNHSNCNSNSNSNSSHSDFDTMQQQQQQQQLHDQQQQLTQTRRHSLYTSNSSVCSTSSTTSTTPPQQQRLPAHLPPPQKYQQQQRHMQHITLQQQQALLRQSPRTFPPSPTDTHSSEEFSGSNEITSSTSPAPCNEIKCTNREHESRHNHHHHHQHQQQQLNSKSNREQQNQTLIATVNQHAKLLPTSISATVSANTNNNNNNNSNNNELPSRIRISKNLINRANIIRSPTPPPSLPPTSALIHIHPQEPEQQERTQQHQQPQMQTLQQHQQQYEYYKQNQGLYEHQHQQKQQKSTSTSSMQNQNLIIRSQHHNSQQIQSSSSPSSLSSTATTCLNLSTHPPNKVSMQHSQSIDGQNQQHLQRLHNGLPFVGTEFELSTDTDDDSVNGEADSSNVLAPWDIAIDALRDTRPKERERVLNLLRKLLNENQQIRYSNLQLSEMIHKRDVAIRELRDQLQSCRRHMQMLSLQQESTIQANGLYHNDNSQIEEMQKLSLSKKSVSLSVCTNMQKNDSERNTKETDNNENGVNTESIYSPIKIVNEKKVNKLVNKELSDSEDEERERNMCDLDHNNDNDDNESCAESELNENENCCEDEESNNLAIEGDIPESTNNRNNSKENESSQQPQVKRSRIESDGESGCSLTDRKDNQHVVNSSFDSDDEMPSSNTDRNGIKIGDDDDEDEATRFTVTNGSSNTDTNTSDVDNDREACIDGSRDENSRILPHSHMEGSDAQAPHNSTLATPPIANSPLSCHSAATAGQLFDSSNSSDESSMKKAQMSACNALAKISDTSDDIDDLSKLKKNMKIDHSEISCKEDENSADIEPDISDERYVAKSRETYRSKIRNCGDNKYINKIGSKTIHTNSEQLTRTPLATKASKKQTPTTNTEILIKKEII